MGDDAEPTTCGIDIYSRVLVPSSPSALRFFAPYPFDGLLALSTVYSLKVKQEELFLRRNELTRRSRGAHGNVSLTRSEDTTMKERFKMTVLENRSLRAEMESMQ